MGSSTNVLVYSTKTIGHSFSYLLETVLSNSTTCCSLIWIYCMLCISAHPSISYLKISTCKPAQWESMEKLVIIWIINASFHQHLYVVVCVRERTLYNAQHNLLKVPDFHLQPRQTLLLTFTSHYSVQLLSNHAGGSLAWRRMAPTSEYIQPLTWM